MDVGRELLCRSATRWDDERSKRAMGVEVGYRILLDLVLKQKHRKS